MNIIVGGVIEKEGKYLLVQEAKKKCFEKWNLPAGHLEFNETIIDAVKREIKEETGCDVKITGICQLANKIIENDIFLSIIFTTELLTDDIKFDRNEILNTKWFSYEDILGMAENLRSRDLIINAIRNSRSNIIAPLDIINIIK